MLLTEGRKEGERVEYWSGAGVEVRHKNGMLKVATSHLSEARPRCRKKGSPTCAWIINLLTHIFAWVEICLMF